MEIYGTAVADKLDRGQGMLTRRYFRQVWNMFLFLICNLLFQHCTMDYGGYTKDLKAIHPDLSSILILDNSPGAYRRFPGIYCFKFQNRFYFLDNAIPIKSWFSDARDTCLLNLLPFLDCLRFTNDVRSVLDRNLQLHNAF